MALDQSALLEVLDALKTAEVDDRIRQAAQTIYQALIEAELTAVIGAAPHEDHGAHARAHGVVGGGGQENRERGERHEGHGDETGAAPHERTDARGVAQRLPRMARPMRPGPA